ncbi:hypothetical protein OUZ56_012598 [Daphnia magna]|uniref:RING-type domain-containing protein n=1 Tax=Daphnia magna TaxID=35525 RepID=A0ABQ9Z3H9_9CRUS|nr:hypothetical protein OUZ56_012598 [Daphnia magna]
MDDENKNEKEVRRINALICTLCPVCQSPFNNDSGRPKRLACSHLHSLKCSTIMFSQNQECIKCGICRGVTQIESGQTVDLSLESDNSFLELSIGNQEIHSDMVVMQEQLRVVRQERDEYLQQRNNLIDQQNQDFPVKKLPLFGPLTSIMNRPTSIFSPPWSVLIVMVNKM